jgi:hypothetical protein
VKSRPTVEEFNIVKVLFDSNELLTGDVKGLGDYSIRRKRIQYKLLQVSNSKEDVCRNIRLSIVLMLQQVDCIVYITAAW